MVYLLVHGAFHGGWCWKRVAAHLRGAGHEVFTPALTGLGERSHLLHREVGVDTHIEDVVRLIEFENLERVILVGHSYAGLVITGSAERLRERLRHLVYLDGYIPNDNQSFFDNAAPQIADQLRELARTKGQGWQVPPAWSAEVLGISDPIDAQWVNSKQTPQSLKTFEQPVRLPLRVAQSLPRTFIYCSSEPTAPYFLPFAQRAKVDGWRYREIPTCHEAMVTAPRELAELLLELG